MISLLQGNAAALFGPAERVTFLARFQCLVMTVATSVGDVFMGFMIEGHEIGLAVFGFYPGNVRLFGFEARYYREYGDFFAELLVMTSVTILRAGGLVGFEFGEVTINTPEMRCLS